MGTARGGGGDQGGGSKRGEGVYRPPGDGPSRASRSHSQLHLVPLLRREHMFVPGRLHCDLRALCFLQLLNVSAACKIGGPASDGGRRTVG